MTLTRLIRRWLTDDSVASVRLPIQAQFQPNADIAIRVDDAREYVLRMGIGYDQDGNADVENLIVVRRG